MKRLPDSEFEIMEIIWGNTPPITTLQIMERMKPDRNLKLQTLLTMLLRLTEKGFLTSERVGRARNYSPTISREDYMRIETGAFMARHYINSMGSLIKTFYDGQNLSPEDIRELQNWLSERDGDDK
ncbi:MAG: BlaI/MecI/CopY family transcriptional regulator [Oscillospiraceae bacterium]|jgi:predicted transcriptional regulator|nr:BlaI/MecI/CopY family transcriptional regulator [Oscillospiraceae bacterium]